MMCFQVVPETPQKEHEIEVVGKLELTHFPPLFHFYTLRKHQNFSEYRSGTLVVNYVGNITFGKHAIRTAKNNASRETSKSLYVAK